MKFGSTKTRLSRLAWRSRTYFFSSRRIRLAARPTGFIVATGDTSHGRRLEDLRKSRGESVRAVAFAGGPPIPERDLPKTIDVVQDLL